VYISLPENEEIMLKNITLSAEEELIRKAKEVARREHTTLNANFQQWLKQYVIKNTKVVDFNKFMEQLDYVDSSGEFTRGNNNER
jgi:N-methylhydantoinase A/oxoprolinase/acetone carboxylase beta subunit